jgi:hypothetical protein
MKPIEGLQQGSTFLLEFFLSAPVTPLEPAK